MSTHREEERCNARGRKDILLSYLRIKDSVLLPLHIKYSVMESGNVDELKQYYTALLLEIEKKDATIRSLENQLSVCASPNSIDTCSAGTGHGAEDFNSSRVIELAKKVRRLTVALEKEKSSNVSLLNKLKQFDQQSVVIREAQSKCNEVATSSPTEIKSMKEKINLYTKKLDEERLHNQTLKQKLRTAHKILEQEVGEGVSFDKLLKDSSNWKGRAQQIAILKDKVKTLTQKILSYNESPIDPQTSDNALQLMQNPIDNVHETNHKRLIQKIEMERKKETAAILTDLQNLKDDYGQLKKKYEASVARNRTLEADNKNLRAKVAIVLEKTKNDDQLISAFQREIDELKREGSCASTEALQNVCTEQEKIISQLREEIFKQNAALTSTTFPRSSSQTNDGHCDLELAKLRELRETLSARLEEKDNIILNLELQLRAERRQHQDATHHKAHNANGNTNRNFRSSMGDEKAAQEQISGSHNTCRSDLDMVQLQSRINVLNDEIGALKITLQATRKSKDDEIKAYSELVDEMRKRFREICFNKTNQ
ncbi:hypothetical protein BKA69DRAFT_1052242 [Paraphysoderma sedebokerense]|nr:hypothetical protein BKA69DRAFT_1052242 [Paraphysoderma sedebokerense]